VCNKRWTQLFFHIFSIFCDEKSGELAKRTRPKHRHPSGISITFGKVEKSGGKNKNSRSLKKIYSIPSTDSN